MSASPRHDKSPNENFDDEIEEGLESFPFPESENNNFLTRREVPPQLGKDDAMLMVDKNLNEQVEKTINTSQGPRPRSQCDGGTKQLKLRNTSKGEASDKVRKERALKRIENKVGKDVMDDMLSQWRKIQELQGTKSKQEILSEGDGVIKTLFNLGFSKLEVTSLLNVGGPRLNRNLEEIRNPSAAKKDRSKPAHAATENDIKRVLEFILSLDIEPGYPCAHRKIPLFVVGDHQGSTWKILHKEYEQSCLKINVRVLSCNRFREYVQHYLPSIKLGKTQTDLCNECYTIQLKMKDPDTSVEEKRLLKMKLDLHLDEANIQRRAMNAYVKAVKERAAPSDPPLQFEPCFIPAVQDEILQESLKLYSNKPNPVLANTDVDKSDSEETLEEEEDTEDMGTLLVHSVWEKEGVPSFPQTGPAPVEKEVEVEKDNPVGTLTKIAKDALMTSMENRTGSKRNEFASTIGQAVVKKMDLEIEDYGQEKLLPSYKLRRPGADYFNSSLNIRNMNFINPTFNGISSIYLYDERTAGKGGNEVCSIRWFNLKKVAKDREDNLLGQPDFHVSVLDNCTGQNKSNTAFKFEALQTTLGLFKSKSKLFLKPGHSHNQSDVVTGESNKFLAQKDLFTIDQLAEEMNKCPNVDVQVLGSDSFYVWEDFLNKHFKDLPQGFTKFYCFEFERDTCAMKKLCSEASEEDEVCVKKLLKDPINGKKDILNELFSLPTDATSQDILRAPLKLPKLPERELKPSKLESLAKKYTCIPKDYLKYYPGGKDYIENKRANEKVVEDPAPANLVANKPKKKPGRPKAPVQPEKDAQQSITTFFKTAPKIPSAMGGSSAGGNSLLQRNCLVIQDTTGGKVINNIDDADSASETAISNSVDGFKRGFTADYTRGGKVAQDSAGIKEIINLDDESETATSNSVTGRKRGFTAAFARGGKFQWCIFF